MRRYGALLVPGLLLILNQGANAQSACDNLDRIVLMPGKPVAGPTDKSYDRVGVFHVPSQRLAPLTLQGSVADGKWTPSANDVRALTTLSAEDHRIVWYIASNPGDLGCLHRINVLGAADVDRPSQSGGTPAAASGDWSACLSSGEQWRADITRSRKTGKNDFTLIVFYEDEGPCYTSRDYGVVGDPIYVGVFTDGATRWGQTRFEPCEIEPAGVRLYIAAEGFPNLREGARTERVLEKRAPRTCYNAALQVAVRGRREGNEVESRIQLAQSQRYHGTIQLGVVFTELHDHEFGLRADPAGNFIFDRGPTDKGPEFTASVVIYSLPKTLASLFRGRFQGRDIVHEQGWLDRIGGFLGVGLTDPADRFVTGLTFELFNGLNVSYVQDFAKVTRLAGVSENVPFTGTQAEIPTRRVWRNHSYVGLGLDLRYVVALFSRR